MTDYEMLIRRGGFIYEAMNNYFRSMCDSYVHGEADLSSEEFDNIELDLLRVNDCMVKALLIDCIYQIHHDFTKEEGELIDNLFKYGNLFTVMSVDEAMAASNQDVLFELSLKRIEEKTTAKLIALYKAVLTQYDKVFLDSFQDLVSSLVILAGVLRDYEETEEDQALTYLLINKYFSY